VIVDALGNWPEWFRPYDRPPWAPMYFRETHNDYLQLLAETGLVAIGLVFWLIYRVFRRIRATLSSSGPDYLPIMIGLIASLLVGAVAEVFDFGLQIPANAVLFCILLGLCIRVGRGSLPATQSYSRPPRR